MTYQRVLTMIDVQLAGAISSLSPEEQIKAVAHLHEQFPLAPTLHLGISPESEMQEIKPFPLFNFNTSEDAKKFLNNHGDIIRPVLSELIKNGVLHIVATEDTDKIQVNFYQSFMYQVADNTISTFYLANKRAAIDITCAFENAYMHLDKAVAVLYKNMSLSPYFASEMLNTLAKYSNAVWELQNTSEKAKEKER